MRTRTCQLHRDDQNQAYWHEQGLVLPHCGICKSCPELQTVLLELSSLSNKTMTTHLGEDDNSWN